MNPTRIFEGSRKAIDYLPLEDATRGTYSRLGFRCGLEIHQQLLTRQKLFCRCPAGIYQKQGEYDAEIIRHMRPTLSEMGEYDGTALMEFKTRKNITYHIQNETACTYDIDDTPPFHLNPEAMNHAIEVALLLKTKIVGEIHITRKQYLDGSIPTGFQRTAILGIDGEIPIRNKRIGIQQISIEEDACREVSDVGHERTYTTDRLGMPLIETVTRPDMNTPEEAEEAGQYLRLLARSTGKVRTGIGAARQDVNVSIKGGTRVEIKGVSHLCWIPRLTHNEAFRQKALLTIRTELRKKVRSVSKWRTSDLLLDPGELGSLPPALNNAAERGYSFLAVNLPGFKGLLAHFTQPGRDFSSELSDRLKVVACLEKPNMTHSEDRDPLLTAEEWKRIRRKLKAEKEDAQILLWGPEGDMKTALETIQERCVFAFKGIPNETRKSLPDGTTLFERVLPGPDRMYPDTDSAPIPVPESMIETARARLPRDVVEMKALLVQWKIPEHMHFYLLRRNLASVLEQAIQLGLTPSRAAKILGQLLRNLERRYGVTRGWTAGHILRLIKFVTGRGLVPEIIPDMLRVWYRSPDQDLEDVLTAVEYRKIAPEEILSRIPQLRIEYKLTNGNKSEAACNRWIMGQLRPKALGNLELLTLRQAVEGVRA